MNNSSMSYLKEIISGRKLNSHGKQRVNKKNNRKPI